MAMTAPSTVCNFPVRDYDLDATLACGQAFRWQPMTLGQATEARPSNGEGAWTGVVRGRWVRLRLAGILADKSATMVAETAEPQTDWRWLSEYLQLETELDAVTASFPDDPPMREAVAACRGLRLLRQEPWECLASFICSSTKQIVQIRQIVTRLCERFGSPLSVPLGEAAAFAFPAPERIAGATESQLRECRLGFRAPYLRETAAVVAQRKIALDRLVDLPLEEARAALMELPGVGRKIADCVLLFACGFPTAFPLDVWVLRALRVLYFHGRHVTMPRLRRFSETHFGPWGGYAQQYLFHYMRKHRDRPSPWSSNALRTIPSTRTSGR